MSRQPNVRMNDEEAVVLDLEVLPDRIIHVEHCELETTELSEVWELL